MSVFGVILVHISLRSDSIQGDKVSLCIQSECRKIWTRTTPNTETFYGASTKQHFKFAHVTVASKNEHSQTFGANTRRT